ncbi:MAG: hypothetical protein SV583_00750 [Pseudomonadota bacterium]|nr:hypothetical protein [Pseudomonadota bacterium]
MSGLRWAEAKQPSARTSLVEPLAGYLLLLTVFAGVVSVVWWADAAVVAGVAVWSAAALLWKGTGLRTRRNAVLLCAVGAITVSLAWGLGVPVPWRDLVITNAALIGLLAAVTFLSLVARPDTDLEELPKGDRAIASTLATVHLFGAVINMSAMFIVADQIQQRNRLTPVQMAAIARAFATAITWSPFFAAMGMALTYAPGADLRTLVGFGLPVAMAGMLYTYWETRERQGARPFVGFPVSYRSLGLPAVLALAVLALHAAFPAYSVVSIVTATAPVAGVLALLIRHRQSGAPILRRHVTHRLPQMRGELLLFVAAGVLSVGLRALIEASPIGLPIDRFGANEACVLLVVMVALSGLGIHPIVNVACFGSLLAPLGADPGLLGLTFLTSWGLGVVINPLSGVNLSMRARYRTGRLTLVALNFRYLLVMLLTTMAVLQGYGLWWLAPQ